MTQPTDLNALIKEGRELLGKAMDGEEFLTNGSTTVLADIGNVDRLVVAECTYRTDAKLFAFARNNLALFLDEIELRGRQKENLHTRLEIEYDKRDALQAEVVELRAEREKLWAVAGAAHLALEEPANYMHRTAMREALAALPERKP